MIEVTGVAASDRWLCDACGGDADLAPVAVEVGLVRLATDGDDGFRLGSGGVERPPAGLLARRPRGGGLGGGGGGAPPAAAARSAPPRACRPRPGARARRARPAPARALGGG